METMLNIYYDACLSALARDERGVTAIEYGLIAGLIAVGLIGALTLTGTSLQAKFNAVQAALAL
jgi:pilus assembly protein Flp/PilA